MILSFQRSSIGQNIPEWLLNTESVWLKKYLPDKNENQVEKVEFICSNGHYALLAPYPRNDVDSFVINECPVEQTGVNIDKKHDQPDIDEAITHNVHEGTNVSDNVFENEITLTEV
ncbi:hypothetical protein GJ496_008676 [Pomphorhynchus laevis]|nr:hypothetical protein GJ496_008676 [Pomphorhynchus laevis]